MFPDSFLPPAPFLLPAPTQLSVVFFMIPSLLKAQAVRSSCCFLYWFFLLKIPLRQYLCWRLSFGCLSCCAWSKYFVPLSVAHGQYCASNREGHTYHFNTISATTASFSQDLHLRRAAFQTEAETKKGLGICTIGYLHFIDNEDGERIRLERWRNPQ